MKDKEELFDDEVSTGASLLSGTTIGGNLAWHKGNDGSGSKLDADTLDGSTYPVSGNIESANITQAGNVLSSFAAPSQGDMFGVGVESNGCIWNVAGYDGDIIEYDQSGTIINNIGNLTGDSADFSDPKGLDFDSSDCIWNADSYVDSIYQADTSGNVTTSFSSPSTAARGLGVDPVTGSLWVSDLYQGQFETSYQLYELDQSGTVQNRTQIFGLIETDGISFASNGSMWIANPSTTNIWRTVPDASVDLVDDIFDSPSSAPKGIGVEPSNQSIWHADDDNNQIYEITGDIPSLELTQ